MSLLGVIRCRSKMLDDIDNKKELQMPENRTAFVHIH